MGKKPSKDYRLYRYFGIDSGNFENKNKKEEIDHRVSEGEGILSIALEMGIKF